jgi:SET domain-containing protein
MCESAVVVLQPVGPCCVSHHSSRLPAALPLQPLAGNLARFINHSCSPNLTIQPILRPGDSALRYLVGVFAEQDIPAGRELCYNYKYTVGSAPQKVITCHCGAKNCKGRLI